MQFDELCALVGALRDRVADLEAKEAARLERETPLSLAELQKMRRDGTLWATGGMAAPGLYRTGERGPETIMPAAVRTRG